MANTTLTPDVILKEAFRVLRNNCPFINSLGSKYDATNTARGVKEGSDIRIKLPQEYTVRTGKVSSVQDNIERSVTLSRSTQKGVDLEFSSAELTQEISRLSELYITPAAAVLASNLDNTAMTTAYQSTYNTVSPIPSTSIDKDDVLEAGVILSQFSTPKDSKRCIVWDERGEADLVSNLSGLFQNSTKISKQYDDGAMGQGLGFMHKMSQNVATHTTGGYDANYLVNDTLADGDSTVTVDTGTGTATVGDVFTMAGCNSVNPVTKADTGDLQKFVVTAAFAGGAGTISFSPALESSATTPAIQNVSALPADNAAITFIGTASTSYKQALAYHPRAYVFATTDLVMPDVGFKARRAEDGVSMRFLGWYDGNADDTLYRLDVLTGTKAVEERMGCRIFSGSNI